LVGVTWPDQLRDAIRAYVAGVSSEGIDAAIVELFAEAQIL
jgi:hypothetical protein